MAGIWTHGNLNYGTTHFFTLDSFASYNLQCGKPQDVAPFPHSSIPAEMAALPTSNKARHATIDIHAMARYLLNVAWVASGAGYMNKRFWGLMALSAVAVLLGTATVTRADTLPPFGVYGVAFGVL